MSDHDCQGASCRCMSGDGYERPPRRSKYRAAYTPFEGTIPGTKGEHYKDATAKSRGKHPGDVPLSPEGAAYKAKLERDTTISLRNYPERRRQETLNETKHHQMTALQERRRQARS